MLSSQDDLAARLSYREPEGVRLPECKPLTRKILTTLVDVWLYGTILFALWFIVF